jgi:hypothetical protein
MRRGFMGGLLALALCGAGCGDDSEMCSGDACAQGDGGASMGDAAAAAPQDDPSDSAEAGDTDAAASSDGDSASASPSDASDDPASDDGDTDPAASDDASDDAGDAAPADEPAFTPAMDGNQGALCESERDCNMGLACYTTGSMGYCTASCDDDDACSGLTGATYTCSNNSDACRVVCGGDEDGPCPQGMSCIDGRCNYPDNILATAGAFERCESSDDCTGELVCNAAQGPGGGSGGGYCTQPCDASEDCTEAPASGSITPGCRMGGSGLCRLDCSDDAEGCPDSMACMNNRCRFTPQQDAQQ